MKAKYLGNVFSLAFQSLQSAPDAKLLFLLLRRA